MTPDSHLLAPPWGLLREGDAAVARFLAAEDFSSARLALEDHWPLEPGPRLRVLAAFVRFQEALELGPAERIAACQAALAGLEAAAEAGLALDAVLPLRESVERVLAEETARELAAEWIKTESATLPELLDAAERLAGSDPKRAADLLLLAAERDHAALAPLHRMNAGRLLLQEAGEAARARPLLLPALSLDWHTPERWEARLFAEGAVTALLEEARGAEFEKLWGEAVALGESLELPFPTGWENQDRLLALLLSREMGVRAAWVASRIEASREYLPRALTERIRAARALARGQA